MNSENAPFCIKSMKTFESKKKKVILNEIIVSKYNDRIVDAMKYYKPISKIT